MNKIHSKTHHHKISNIKILKTSQMIKTGHAQQKTMWRGNKIKVIDSLVATLNAVKQSLQNSLKKKKIDVQPRILYPKKLLIKSESKIKF